MTPRGWERGSTRVQGRGNTWTDEPEDRAMSFVYKEVETAAQPGVRKSVEETWRPRDEEFKPAPLSDETERLLERHGPCPESL